MYYLVTKFAKFQKLVYLMDDNDVKAKEVEDFTVVLNLSSKDLLGDTLEPGIRCLVMSGTCLSCSLSARISRLYCLGYRTLSIDSFLRRCL